MYWDHYSKGLGSCSFMHLLHSMSIVYADEPPEMRELQLMKWRKGGQEKHLRIIANTAPRWKELGTTLGISPAELEGFERQRILNQEECCRSVLQRWLENGSQPREAYPVTWRGLFEALRDTGKCGQIATDLKTALCQREKSLYMIRLVHIPWVEKYE